jgi:hypothetical protein
MRVLFTLALILGLGLSSVIADEPADTTPELAPDKPFSFWMQKKLEYSQQILEGLATGNLNLVAEKSRQIRFLSGVEGWIRKGKPGYTAQLQAFEFANSEIERHARAGNLEGATMGFQQLTISCVSCHAILRHPQ